MSRDSSTKIWGNNIITEIYRDIGLSIAMEVPTNQPITTIIIQWGNHPSAYAAVPPAAAESDQQSVVNMSPVLGAHFWTKPYSESNNSYYNIINRGLIIS